MAAPPATRQRPDRTLVYAALVIVAGVLATTLAQTQVLARLPLQNLLKNELHADRTANAAFFFWAGLAWYLKPFAGILTDAFPLFGSRRKSYILVSATLAALSWLVLIVTPHEYRDLLFVVIVINTFMMVASTVVGGYMVETAQAIRARVASLRCASSSSKPVGSSMVPWPGISPASPSAGRPRRAAASCSCWCR
jgi:BT1 family